jgi:hypothetical protein
MILTLLFVLAGGDTLVRIHGVRPLEAVGDTTVLCAVATYPGGSALGVPALKLEKLKSGDVIAIKRWDARQACRTVLRAIGLRVEELPLVVTQWSQPAPARARPPARIS